MEGETQSPPPAKMARRNQLPPDGREGETHPRQPLPESVYKVLDDRNLLAEIIVRVGFPTSLVRAAAVCRRWLRIASDRAFLRRFRKLHPPRLLGFYRAQRYPDLGERFFPMLPQPQPPELAAVVSRASVRLDTYNGARTDIVGCWNGRVVTSLHICHMFNRSRSEIFTVHSPLCSERGMAVIPTLEITPQQGSFCSRQLLSKEEGDVVSYFYVMLEYTKQGKSVVKVYMLQDGDDAWCTRLTLTMDYFIGALSRPNGVLLGNKIYMVSDRNEILVLDLMASSFYRIPLPQGVDFNRIGTAILSRADDTSTVYLIHAKELQLHIWLHKGGNWLLVDNICLSEMCARFLEDEPAAVLQINHVGDYTAEFLFLQMGRYTLYLDVKCRTLRKVHDRTNEDRCFGNIYPFMMIWPPIFHVLKDGPARFASLPFIDLYCALVEFT